MAEAMGRLVYNSFLQLKRADGNPQAPPLWHREEAFYHDRLVYASLEEAAGEIRKNRLTHPSLRAIRFQVEMTNKGGLPASSLN